MLRTILLPIVFRLLKDNFLMVLSSSGTTRKKAMERVPWMVLEGP